MIRQTQCPYCNTPAQKVWASQKLVKCASCSLTWFYLPEPREDQALYSEGFYKLQDNRKSIFERIIFAEARHILRVIESKMSQTSPYQLLDFGCGKGQFLAMAKVQGFKALGIETEKERADFGREHYQVNVQTDFYQDGAITDEPFDVITLLHVLEHLPQPLGLLKELTGQNLRDKGMLVIEVPNYDSWQSQWAGQKWMQLDLPRHLSHWHPLLLQNAVEEIGFHLVKKEFYSLHLGVLSMLDTLMKKTGYQGHLIGDLKHRKTALLMLRVGFLFPLAFILEFMASRFRKGGIMRFYFRKKISTP